MQSQFSKTSPLEIKAESSGHVEGVAWSFAHAPDAVGDHLLPGGFSVASERLPMRLEHGEDVGAWESTSIDDQAFRVVGQIDKSTRLGRETAARAAGGELSGLSIGFSGEFQRSGPNRIFTRALIEETSLTTRPANAGGRVTAVKSLNDCTALPEFEKALAQRLGLSRRQAATIAPQLFSQMHGGDAALMQIHSILKSF